MFSMQLSLSGALGNRVPLGQLARCERGGVRASIALRWRHDPPCPTPDPNRKAAAMGLFSKDIETMDDLFVHTLRDIYYAENQILKTLPDMIDKATDAQLKQAFQSHLTETKNQVKRLDQVFQMRGVEAKGVDCPAIDGILEEADDIAGEIEEKEVLDAALAAAGPALPHHQ